MKRLLERLTSLVARRERFTYDLRGDCLVDQGTVAPYRPSGERSTFPDLHHAIAHALEHDGILGARRDPVSGEMNYASCRLFTDQDHALRFAEAEGQPAVYNMNRMIEVAVPRS